MKTSASPTGRDCCAESQSTAGSAWQGQACPTKALSKREAMLGHATDVLIGYCSSRSPTPDTSVDKVELLRTLAIHADCGTTLVKTANAFQ